MNFQKQKNNQKQNITFVTSLMTIYDAPYDEKTIQWRIDRFKEIAETGILICLYVSADLFVETLFLTSQYTNIKLAKIVNIEDTFSYKTYKEAGVDANITLPEYRNHAKDTANYMLMMNSKLELLNDAVEQNVWNTPFFAWIDFSITYIFKEKARTLEYLRFMSVQTYNETTSSTFLPFLAIPGCTDKVDDIWRLTNGVVWRFCGGFMLGNAAGIRATQALYVAHFGDFLREHRRLVWEVNFWAWLEAKQPEAKQPEAKHEAKLEAVISWTPIWYSADHNDSIVKIPVHLYAQKIKCLEDKENKITYEYPQIENFFTMQTAQVEFQGKHYLNTRFINYTCLDTGCYHIHHPENIIISQNYVTEIDENTLLPITPFRRMREEETVALESKNCFFRGLEDIRLYVFENRVKFIATNINYSPYQWNSMIVGDYNVETGGYENAAVICSPNGERCEKNWIPVVLDGEELFIYRWFPMEIGKIVEDDTGRKMLQIVKTYEINAPNFERVRGSTVFTKGGNADLLVGLVHFSDDSSPRRYYHILVGLCKLTLKPMKYSDVFYFQHLGIEFCTGFDIWNDKYICWISKWDREPSLQMIDEIELKYDFV